MEFFKKAATDKFTGHNTNRIQGTSYQSGPFFNFRIDFSDAGSHSIDGKHPDGSLSDQAQVMPAAIADGGKKNFKAPARESADKKISPHNKSLLSFFIICHRSMDFIHGIEWDNL